MQCLSEPQNERIFPRSRELLHYPDTSMLP